MKICDFGARTEAHPSQTRWMAPEVLVGGAYSAASDVWSLGVTMWVEWKAVGGSYSVGGEWKAGWERGEWRSLGGGRV